MFFRYSSNVVAPISCNCPRASAGFRIFAASIEPSPPAPAPVNKCSSSINKITSSFSIASSITPLIRSSNSPRNFVPATISDKSTWIIRFPTSDPGTSFFTIRSASPSTIAVFPTPASPISTGLDFVRRLSTVTTRSISRSRPITVSSFPSFASSVKSCPNRRSHFSGAFLYCFFFSWFCSLRICCSIFSSSSSSSSSSFTPIRDSSIAPREFGWHTSAYSRYSVPTTCDPLSFA